MRDSRTVLREAAGEVPAAYSPGPSIYQTDNSPYAGVQILLVGQGNFGWDRALADVEERPEQEFTAGLGTVLRPGHYRVVVPGEY